MVNTKPSTSLVPYPKAEIVSVTAEIDSLLKHAAEQIAAYRIEAGLPAVDSSLDVANLRMLVEGKLFIPETIDVGEKEAVLSVHGNNGNSGEHNVSFYNGAQVTLLTLFQQIHHRKPTLDEYTAFGRAFALIARGLLEYQNEPDTQSISTRVRVRSGVILVLIAA